ncbi:MAG: response regulator [Myxococcota bacterium]
MPIDYEAPTVAPPPLLLQEMEDRARLEPAVGRVLVVEDDPAQRELLVEMLLAWRYQPLAVGTAEEAEHAARRNHFEAAIVDIFLPGKSGEALIGTLRERFPDSVLIGISALGDSMMARRCKVKGADLFLSKPIDPEALAQALQTNHKSWH